MTAHPAVEVGTFRRAMPTPPQRVALLLFFLVPLVPRPTFGGTTSLIAPAIVLLLVYAALLHALAPVFSRASLLSSGVFGALAFATMLYAARVAWNGESGEAQFVVSRVLLVTMVVCCASLLDPDLSRQAIRWFVAGVVPLAAITAFIAVTGFVLLEAPLPARTLGITFPWHKTAGVPRSFGEQGIIASMALGYALVYGRVIRRSTKWLIIASCLVLVAAGQSRNIFLGSFTVVAMWLLVVRPRRHGWMRPALVACGAATFLVQEFLPWLTAFGFVRDLVGEGIYARNVESRFTLVNGATRMIADSPFRAFVGWSHEHWRLFAPIQTDAGVHNFFASSFLFLGLVGGGLTIWALFVRPLAIVTTELTRHSAEKDAPPDLERQWAVVAGAGVLTSLNFYEGFFSLALALYVAVIWHLSLRRRATYHRTAEVSRRSMRRLSAAGQRRSHDA